MAACVALLVGACRDEDREEEVPTSEGPPGSGFVDVSDSPDPRDDVSGSAVRTSDPSDVSSAAPGDVTDGPPREYNACGGGGPLLLDGSPSAPGQACGEGGHGVVICAGLEAVRCIGQPALNVCGSPGELPVEPGAACGVCEDGEWVCTADGGVACEGASAPNACGGCGSLAGPPGRACALGEADGMWVCAAAGDEVVCADAGNACGGDTPLLWEDGPARPGDPCALSCGQGVLTCAEGGDALACVPDLLGDAPNACGGCGPLAGVPGAPCGVCGDGVWTCGADGTATCIGGRSPDACGGCDAGAPVAGDTCAGGRWVCAGEAAACIPHADDANACGGNRALDAVPGTACGACDEGVHFCAGPNLVACGPGAGGGPNACGGCSPLRGMPGAACGTCLTGALACDGSNEGLVCQGDVGESVLNDCGRCGALDGAPEEACGTCLAWTCNPAGALRCEPTDALPGCEGTLTCEDLDCADDGRLCAYDEDDLPVCGACLAGLQDIAGFCADGLVLVPDAVSLAPGESVSLTAQAWRDDVGPVEVTDEVDWSVVDDTVASVSSTGLVTGVADGSTTVMATAGELDASATVVVTTPVVSLERVEVTPASATLRPEETVSLTATAHFDDGSTEDVTDSAQWTSGTPGVATVAAGLVTAIDNGTAVITATWDSTSGTATISVSDTEPILLRIEIQGAPEELLVGEDVQLQLRAFFDDGSDRDVSGEAEWTSLNPAVATVTAGRVVAVAPGTTALTAAYRGAEDSLDLDVLPSFEPVALVISPAETVRLGVGVCIRLRATLIGSGDEAIDVTDTVLWTTSRPTAVEPSGPAGRFCVIGTGTTTLATRLGEFTAQTQVIPQSASLSATTLRTPGLAIYRVAYPSSFTTQTSETLPALYRRLVPGSYTILSRDDLPALYRSVLPSTYTTFQMEMHSVTRP